MGTNTVDVAALFMLGLLGTGHCIGMCGPLVVALPGQTGRFSAHLFYHAGRLTTYGAIGALMGLAGGGMVHLSARLGGTPLVWMARTQVGIGLFAGLFLLLFGLFRLGYLPEPAWLAVAAPNRLPGWRRLMNRAVDQGRPGAFYGVGLLLGGLPCGLSYAAFARALSSADALAGAGMAAVFGLGTLPGMLAVGAGSGLLHQRYRRQADLLAGLIMLAMGAVLLVRAVESVAG